jgi:hypothetical protein
MLRCRSLAVVAAIAMALPACDSSPHDEASPTRHGTTDASVLVANYESVSSPEELARQADLVVLGTLAGADTGQSYAPIPEAAPEVVTSVVWVSVDRLLAGDASLVTDGSIFIEVDHPSMVGAGSAEGTEGGSRFVPFDTAAFNDSVPIGLRGVFFLEDITDEPMWETVIDGGAGRPAGAPLLATYVQGFLIEDADGRLISVREPLDNMGGREWQELETLDDVVDAVA